VRAARWQPLYEGWGIASPTKPQLLMPASSACLFRLQSKLQKSLTQLAQVADKPQTSEAAPEATLKPAQDAGTTQGQPVSGVSMPRHVPVDALTADS